MPLRIYSFPGQSKNPYLELFYQALEPYGVEQDPGFRFSPHWVAEDLGRGDVLHFHWPELLWTKDNWTGGKPKPLVLLRLWRLLRAARRGGVKVLWTVHNFDLFEDDSPLDRLGLRLLARYSDLLVVHRATMVEGVQQRYGSDAPVVVMPHGNYKGHYPEPRPRPAVLADLGIDEGAAVLCCVGRLRDYKGLDVSRDAFVRLAEALGQDAVHLVVAGMPHPGFDDTFLEAFAEAHPSVTFMPRMISDQEMIDVLSVSEALWLPFRQITGSGTLLLAWSYGCGTVASDLAFFREVIPDGSAAGRLVPVDDADALAEATRAYLAVPRAERREAALAEAAKYDWDRCVKDLGAVLLTWQHTEPSPAPQPTP